MYIYNLLYPNFFAIILSPAWCMDQDSGPGQPTIKFESTLPNWF